MKKIVCYQENKRTQVLWMKKIYRNWSKRPTIGTGLRRISHSVKGSDYKETPKKRMNVHMKKTTNQRMKEYLNDWNLIDLFICTNV